MIVTRYKKNTVLIALLFGVCFYQHAQSNTNIMKYDDSTPVVISEEGYLGLKDKKGEVICAPKYDKIFSFQCGRAIVCYDGLYGIIAQDGEEIVEPSLNYISDFYHGIAWFTDGTRFDNGYFEWGVINDDGKIIAVPGSVSIREVPNEALYNGGIISKNGELIYTTQEVDHVLVINNRDIFHVSEFVNGVNIKTYFEQRRKENLLGIPPYKRYRRDYLYFFNEGLALVPKVTTEGVKVTFINMKGEPVFKESFDDAYYFLNGISCVKKDGKWGAINKEGKFIISPEYEYLESTTSDYFIFGTNHRFGVIDKNRQEVLPAKYSDIKHLFGHTFACLDDKDISLKKYALHPYGTDILPHQGGWGAINIATNTIVLPFDYDHVRRMNSNFGVGVKYFIKQDSLRNKELPPTSLYQAWAVPRASFWIVGSNCQVFDGKGELGLYKSDTASVYDNLMDRPTICSSLNLYKKENYGFRFGEDCIDSLGVHMKCNTKQKPYLIIVSSGVDNGSMGVVNKEGRIILPTEYDSIQIMMTGFIVKKEDLFGFLDIDGNVIIPIEYDNMQVTVSGLLRVSKNKENYLINKKELTIKEN